MRRSVGFLASSCLLGACASRPADDTGSSSFTCNGDVRLCDRSVAEITFPATHNSMSSEEAGWYVPNQHHAVPTQLEGGIRGLNLDLHSWADDGEEEEQPYLCHGYCSLGAQPLVEGLVEIADYLDAHPRVFLWITLESYVPGEDVVAAFEEARLASRAYAHAAGEPWPTLRWLLDRGWQVAVFASDDAGAADWYMDQWTHWQDNPYHYETEDDFSCERHRGEADSALLNINHFYTDPVATEGLAEQANDPEVLRDHVEACVAAFGRPASQVLVDFYDVGGLMEVVEEQNGLEP